MDEPLFKINRITVLVDMEDDDATINFYKTNQLIGSISYQRLNLLSPKDTQLPMKAYADYARDVAINLIDNGGLTGFYYEEKQKIEGIKYNLQKFKEGAKEFIIKVLDDIKFNTTGSDINQSSEYYDDASIKNAVMDLGISIGDYELHVRCEIKSGQLCRPRIMIYDGVELAFNITNIKHIMRGR